MQIIPELCALISPHRIQEGLDRWPQVGEVLQVRIPRRVATFSTKLVNRSVEWRVRVLGYEDGRWG